MKRLLKGAAVLVACLPSLAMAEAGRDPRVLTRIIGQAEQAVVDAAGQPDKACATPSPSGPTVCEYWKGALRVWFRQGVVTDARLRVDVPDRLYRPEDVGVAGPCKDFYVDGMGDQRWDSCLQGLSVGVTPIGKTGTDAVLIQKR